MTTSYVVDGPTGALRPTSACDKLIDQLSSDYGSKYTLGQATDGAREAGPC